VVVAGLAPRYSISRSSSLSSASDILMLPLFFRKVYRFSNSKSESISDSPADQAVGEQVEGYGDPGSSSSMVGAVRAGDVSR
jgi:hypothetical protein